MSDKKHAPDYEEIARLERELGMSDAPAPSNPMTVAGDLIASSLPPAIPPPAAPAPMFARCRGCGAHVPHNATACPNCNGQTFWTETDW